MSGEGSFSYMPTMHPAPIEAPGPMVCGHRSSKGWMVRLSCGGELTAEEARALAAELVDYADLADGKLW